MSKMDVSVEDLLYFVGRALDGMSGILVELGDDLANQSPELPGANSPFVILTHCLGVMEYWGGHVIAGREIHRDRPSEFTARGAVDELLAKVPVAREKLNGDVAGIDLSAPALNPPAPPYESPRSQLTNGVVVLHILEELVQHHGQMEITRDFLNDSGAYPKSTR